MSQWHVCLCVLASGASLHTIKSTSIYSRQGFVVKNSRKIPQGSKLHSYEVMNDLINGEHPTKQQFDQRPKLSLLQFSNESLRLF